MFAFFLTFLSVLLAMFAGREALRVARLAEATGGVGTLVALVAGVSVLACVLAAWLAGTFADLLSPQQRGWFVAAALVLAALEVMLLGLPDTPREPTRSLGAIGLVLFAGVLTDASGLLVLSIGIATGQAGLAAAGGALACAAALGAAAFARGDWEKLPRRTLQVAVGIALMAGAAVIVFAPPTAFA